MVMMQGTESVGLYMLDADQGSVTRLHDGDFYGLPTWSSDGSQVYISVPRTSAVVDGGILAVPVDGSAPTWLISLQELDTHIPTMRVSPDGRKIAAPVGGGGPPQLAVMSVDDPQTRVVVGDDLFIDGDPVWSPDSRQIAFIGLHPLPTPDQPNSYGQGQLYVVNADGTGLSQLTDNWPSNPVWSPDGQQIAYSMSQTATPGTEQMVVYVSAVDGSDTRNLSNDPEYVDTGPSWSPDGREVAFVSQPVDDWRVADPSGEEPMIADIRVIMADGTHPRTVVAGVQFEHFMELIGRPAWRPTAP
jgi:Tol biopolymer transport system component